MITINCQNCRGHGYLLEYSGKYRFPSDNPVGYSDCKECKGKGKIRLKKI